MSCERGTCRSCGNLKRGNIHHPDGRIERDQTVCINRLCEPGLNFFWRPKAVSA